MTNIIQFSELIEENGKTVRENNCAIKHKIAIGQLVEAKYDEYFGNNAGQKVHAHLYVISHDRDCDGTPLYTVARKPRDQWDLFEKGDSRDPYEVWRKAPFSPAGLFIASCYRPVNGLNEDQLHPLSEDSLPLTDVPTPRWPDCFASEDLREKYNWRQNTPLDELKSLVMAAWGQADNVVDGSARTPQKAAEAISDVMERITALLPFLEYGSWK